MLRLVFLLSYASERNLNTVRTHNEGISLNFVPLKTFFSAPSNLSHLRKRFKCTTRCRTSNIPLIDGHSSGHMLVTYLHFRNFLRCLYYIFGICDVTNNFFFRTLFSFFLSFDFMKIIGITLEQLTASFCCYYIFFILLFILVVNLTHTMR